MTGGTNIGQSSAVSQPPTLHSGSKIHLSGMVVKLFFTYSFRCFQTSECVALDINVWLLCLLQSHMFKGANDLQGFTRLLGSGEVLLKG